MSTMVAATTRDLVGGAVGRLRWLPDTLASGAGRDVQGLLGPGRDYDPRPGDVWMVSAVRPAGAEVVLPREWRGAAHRQRVPWRGRLADQTLWRWTLEVLPAPRVVLVRFPRPVDADIELRIFRPPSVFTCEDCGRTSQHPKDLEQGYCGACHAFTGTPAFERLRLWAARWEVPAADEEEEE